MERALGDLKFLSTPSARRATQCPEDDGQPPYISIHALREEGDFCTCLDKEGQTYFYPRPPRGGRRNSSTVFPTWLQFLSTPSARRATQKGQAKRLAGQISIHALREEGDVMVCAVTLVLYRFLSTPSARRATLSPFFSGGNFQISIHALREEGDPMPVTFGVLLMISIHALREEGDVFDTRTSFHHPIFLSTPSARRATAVVCTDGETTLFLSTPSARRATVMVAVSSCAVLFLSTPSARRATPCWPEWCSRRPISIHALREEGDS